MRLSVRSRNQRSTRFNHELAVGVTHYVVNVDVVHVFGAPKETQDKACPKDELTWLNETPTLRDALCRYLQLKVAGNDFQERSAVALPST